MGAIRAFSTISPFSQVAILEIGAHLQGQLPAAARILEPDIAIVTLLALEHKSAFKTIENIGIEKASLVQHARSPGVVLLNADDPGVMAMAKLASARVKTFGRVAAADYRFEQLGQAAGGRLRLRVSWQDRQHDLETRFIGVHLWLPVAAAVTAALELGVSIDDISSRLKQVEPVFGRCSILAIRDGPAFLLDTRKSPWHSLQLSFDALEQMTASRKRIVLGHISDFMGSNRKYAQAYQMARQVADEVIFVGRHAHRSRSSEADQLDGRFYSFATTQAAFQHIKATAVAGEAILLKGSSDLHLERIAVGFDQTINCWPSDCGVKGDCPTCGCLAHAFHVHGGRANRLPRQTA
jgi:UDP-N-acetylmuramoyl-tripeptide--D-alanyl-D-alanine ligase